MKNIKQQVMNLVTPIALDFGLEIIEVEYVKKHDGMNLTIFIDKEGGVTINDCELLHRAIDLPLDELNPTDDQPYTLNVSSLGLDRPLTTPRDFTRNLNKEIEVTFFALYEGQKKIVGVLASFDNDGFVVQTKTNSYTIPYKKAAHIKPVIKF